MIPRPYWLDRLERAWNKAPLVWLTGVRRVGKTVLSKSIPGAHYCSCDLPSISRQLEDPERFFASLEAPIVILDEVHRLPDPSRVLKIATDHFGHLKILATGSSALAATRKFKDTLTGRRRVVHLLPVLDLELDTFGVKDLVRRFFHGGLPEPLLSREKDPEYFSEWLDSYYARDVQELFRVGKRRGFLMLVEHVLRNSGGLLDQSNLARLSGLSRPTVASYLDVLQLTHLAYFLRPYHRGGKQELVRQPKVYGFDTGFVTHLRGWGELRHEDLGGLFEHLVLESLIAHLGIEKIRYWRDKQKNEIDFVIPAGRTSVDAIECKWDPDRLPTRGLAAFRQRYPTGRNLVVTPHLPRPYTRKIHDLEITFTNIAQMTRLWTKPESG